MNAIRRRLQHSPTSATTLPTTIPSGQINLPTRMNPSTPVSSTHQTQSQEPDSPVIPSALPGPHIRQFYDLERHQAELERERVLHELKSCEQEREKLWKTFCEVESWGIDLWRWREYVQYKIEKAEATLKIIDELSSNVQNNSVSNNNNSN